MTCAIGEAEKHDAAKIHWRSCRHGGKRFAEIGGVRSACHFLREPRPRASVRLKGDQQHASRVREPGELPQKVIRSTACPVEKDDNRGGFGNLRGPIDESRFREPADPWGQALRCGRLSGLSECWR